MYVQELGTQPAPSTIPSSPFKMDLCEPGLSLLHWPGSPSYWVTEQHAGVLGINWLGWVNGTFARGTFAYTAQEAWPLTGEINTWRFGLFVVPSLVPCQSLGLIFFFLSSLGRNLIVSENSKDLFKSLVWGIKNYWEKSFFSYWLPFKNSSLVRPAKKSGQTRMQVGWHW